MSSIHLLNQVSLQIRKQREANKYMAVNKVTIKFKLDEKNIPSTYELSRRIQANSLVEEYMLLANILVGEELVKFNK